MPNTRYYVEIKDARNHTITEGYGHSTWQATATRLYTKKLGRNYTPSGNRYWIANTTPLPDGRGYTVQFAHLLLSGNEHFHPTVLVLVRARKEEDEHE